MPWFRVDDGFWSHPKVIDRTAAALALWVRAGSYSMQHLTDGYISPGALRMLGGTLDDAAELVDARLWDVNGDGWSFHEWTDRQPTRKQIEADREATRQRVAKHRAARQSNAVTSPATNGGRTAVPVPSHPNPTHTQIEDRSDVREPVGDPSSTAVHKPFSIEAFRAKRPDLGYLSDGVLRKAANETLGSARSPVRSETAYVLKSATDPEWVSRATDLEWTAAETSTVGGSTF